MVLISAHMGGGEAARPGSFEAYQRALSSGAEYAEMDIRKTGDGVLVCYHDEHAGHGGPPVAELSYPERRHGIGVMVRTVDGDRLIDRFLASRMVDVLITNRPGYAVSRRAASRRRGNCT